MTYYRYAIHFRVSIAPDAMELKYPHTQDRGTGEFRRIGDDKQANSHYVQP
jgi:hypothetical protein